MEKGPNRAGINKEFTCDYRGCKKKCEEVWSFTQYGGEARREEFLKGTSYCEDCFKKMEEKLA